MADLHSAFVSELPEPLRVQAAQFPELPASLEAFVAKGRAAWPELDLPEQDVVAHFAKRLPRAGQLRDQLRRAQPGDVYLACGCARGNAAATSALERTYGPDLRAALAGLATDRIGLDDLVQIVKQKLYGPGRDGQSTIAQYNGLGRLGGWLRVVGTRTALNALRDAGAKEAVELAIDPAGGAGPMDDPELDYIKQHYRHRFKVAFEDAVSDLTLRERTLLRYSVVHRLTVREIARMYGVHHATTARWIANAREALVARTREFLATNLGVTGEQLESIMRMIESRIDVSVARALGPAE